MALLPLSKYRDGDDFNDSIVSGASSCVAFAKYVYGQLFSKDGDEIEDGASITTITEGPWVHTDYNGGHDMIIGTQTATKVWVYDANWTDYGSGNPYTVRYKQIPITDFTSGKKFKIKGGKMAGTK